MRLQAAELESKNDELTGRISELEAQLARLAAEAAATQGSGPLAEEIRAATPEVVSLKIGGLSHAADENGDGRAELLRVYVEPADGLGRMVQLVGTITVHAATMPPDADAVTLGRAAFTPAQIRQAYRSGITGTHYTLEVPIEIPANLLEADSPGRNSARSAPLSPPRSPPQCHVRVEYTDGHTGRTIAAERTIALDDRPKPR